jgi:hypothetical protein
MARIGFCSGSYQSESISAECQRCVNWYPENIESGWGKSQVALYPTPGLSLLYSGTAGGRGLVTVQGRTFDVMGTTFRELLANNTATNRGTVVTDGKSVSMAGGPNQLLIASAGNAYVYDLIANTLTLLPTGGANQLKQAVSMVAYSDGFFLALYANSNQVAASNSLDATTWPGLSITQVSVFTDNVLSMIVDHREVWLWGPKASQPYFDSGNFPFPFDIVQGGFIEQGCGAQFSPARLDNSIFWLGADERGNAIGWRAQGYQPVRISNHAVENAWQGYTTVSDAVGYAYQDQGHAFYVLTFPTASKTWVYDVSTGMWHERGFWNSSFGAFTAHRAQYHTFNFGKHLVSDPTNGNVYQMSIQFLNDFGNPIRRVRTAPHISSEQEWILHHQLQVDFEVGLGPTPPLQATGAPVILTLKDSNNALWNVFVTDTGLLQTQSGATGTAQTIILNDQAQSASWQLGITTLGLLTTTLLAFSANPTQQFMVSLSGQTAWQLGVLTNGNLITSRDFNVFARGPLANLRWSNDGGKTFSNLYTADCGKAGEYAKRAMWRRLGRSRDRVYELSVTDPISWRVVDAYLKASPGFTPQERLVKEYGKRA